MIITLKDNKFNIEEDIPKNFLFLNFQQKFIDILLLNIFNDNTFLFTDNCEHIDIDSFDKSKYVYIKYNKFNHDNFKIYNFPFNSTYIETFFNIRFSRLLYTLNEFLFVIQLNDVICNIQQNKFLSNDEILSLDIDDLNSLFNFLIKNNNFDFAYDLFTLQYNNIYFDLDLALDILDSNHQNITNIYFKNYTYLREIIQSGYFEDYYLTLKKLPYFQDNKNEFLDFINKNKDRLEKSFIEKIMNEHILDNF